MMTPTGVSATLADFASDTGWSDLPESTKDAARRTFGNTVSLAVGASASPAVVIARRALRKLGSPPDASVLGTTERLGLLAAPLVNGIAAHLEDFDDTHLQTVVHPGAPIVPAALAMAEHTGADGQDLLTAVAVGVEVALRFADGICPEHFDRGWHLTGTAGHVGAAVAAGRLAGLRGKQLVDALGLGATQAAGLTEALGTMTKPFHPGKAASDGVQAALLAAGGFSGPAEPIAGRGGLATLVSSRFSPEQMLDGLGSKWELEKNAFKAYACGIVSHAIIDAGRYLRTRLPTDAVADVEVRAHPVVREVMGVADPRSGLESKFSAYHAFAVGFLDDAGGLAQFSEQRAQAEDARDLRRRVRVVDDPTVARGAAQVVATAVDGGTERVDIEHATGSLARPMTDVQLVEKARSVVLPVLGDGTEPFLEHAFAVDTTGFGALLSVAQRTEGA